MKKLVSFIAILSMLLICFSSCSGYNKIMRDHLSNPNNYKAFEIVLHDMYYQDPNTYEKVRNFENTEYLEYDMMFSVTFETIEEVSIFLGGSPNPDIILEEYQFQFTLCITAENNKKLDSNGFYDRVSLGDKIGITTSTWIYMDSKFFYIAQVEYDGTEYLNFEEGLKNIVNMMDKNKSLL